MTLTPLQMELRWVARRMVREARADGRLNPRPPACHVCGVGGRLGGSVQPRWSINYHHSDYAQPLAVLPVCDRCHRRIHNGLDADPGPTVRATPSPAPAEVGR